MKEKIQSEVTKIKEKLENYLSESNRIIKINEKINKGVKLFEKEEKSMIKTLSYVSKINKNQKKASTLFQELMKNIKIAFNEKDNDIKYDEYYFSGIQKPKNIQFNDIYLSCFKLSWEIDDIKIENINNNDIKYRVEVRKENDKFNNVYEGNNKNCTIKNLIQNSNYEVRICCIYNNMIGPWSDIQKAKTLDNECDSNILLGSKREKEFLSKIY